MMPPATIYLDTAAHGPRLVAVHEAGQAALQAGAFPWRLDMQDWRASIEGVRAAAATVLDGTHADNSGDSVALVPSASYGLAIAARNLPLTRGEAVLVLDGQFPSNLLPWQQRCVEVGGRVVAARRTPAVGWTDAVLELLRSDPGIRILALPHVYWHDGEMLDLDRIAEAAHAVGAALVLDLSQSLGALPVNLARWRPQFVVAVGHKWLLGPHGLAYLWAAPRWREHGVSIEQHWSAFDGGDRWRFPVDAMAPLQAGARRFDAGGVADPLRLAMAAAALQQVNDWGVAWIAAQLRERTAGFATALRERGLHEWVADVTPAHFLGVRASAPEALVAVAAALPAAGIIATARHGVLRIAPHLHVGAAEMHRAAQVLGDLVDARGA